MNPGALAAIQRQMSDMQAMLQAALTEAVAAPADDDQELTDQDLFVILHCRGYRAYRTALTKRNKQRTARLNRWGHL